jgi:hypothetical protein
MPGIGIEEFNIVAISSSFFRTFSGQGVLTFVGRIAGSRKTVSTSA